MDEAQADILFSIGFQKHACSILMTKQNTGKSRPSGIGVFANKFVPGDSHRSGDVLCLFIA